jgi:hypothetical protein
MGLGGGDELLISLKSAHIPAHLGVERREIAKGGWQFTTLCLV